MLLEFSASNYKSFKDKFVFSLVPAPKQKGLDYSIQKQKIAGKQYKALSSAVIYGPNASGKTNIIGAMDTMKSIVLRGNIRNADSMSTPNLASHRLEFIPFYHHTGLPISFAITFIESGLLISYEFEIAIGDFLNSDFPRKVLREKLVVNDNLIFDRGSTLFVLNAEDNSIKLFNDGVILNFDSALEIAKGSLNDDELFLLNGFKNIFSKSLVALIYNWFAEKFIVICCSDSIETTRQFADPKDGQIYVEKTLTEAARSFGITSNALGYKILTGEGRDAILCSLIKQENTNIAIPAQFFESYGTLRFINEFPLVIRAMLTGATLIMDEFDASLHPLALMNIINIFHNDEINRNQAQLVFNTHNPIFLNADVFRRDEIKFVERDDESHESVHYSLSDFKTGGPDSTRRGEDYMRNYFISKYGAIKNVDFSDILDSIVNGEGEDHA